MELKDFLWVFAYKVVYVVESITWSWKICLGIFTSLWCARIHYMELKARHGISGPNESGGESITWSWKKLIDVAGKSSLDSH